MRGKRMIVEQIQEKLNELVIEERLKLLICYGHQLTIMCREAYEFQAPGVTNPRLLRDANEIHHRVYQAILELAHSENDGFSVSGISHWISADERSEEIQNASIQAFKWALEKYNT
jgi:hypothetical protein